MLYNRDIEIALKDFAVDEQVTDILEFDACFRGNVETAYAMKDATSVMVGSEGLVPECSWNRIDVRAHAACYSKQQFLRIRMVFCVLFVLKIIPSRFYPITFPYQKE